MQWPGIGSLPQVDVSTSPAMNNFVWLEGNDAISHFSGFFPLAHLLIDYCGTNKNLDVSRIQLHCMLEVAHGIMPTVLTAVDEPAPLENLCLVGQGTDGDRELVTRVVVIQGAMVKVP